MSKSIFAMVQGNVEKEIRAKENEIKAEFLEFLNKEFEKLLEERKYWQWATRNFKLNKGESHPEWKKVAEEMGFDVNYEFDSYYGDTITLIANTDESEARKLIDRHNKKVEKVRKEEQKKKEAIVKVSRVAADIVVKELLKKLRSGNYELREYGEEYATLKVTYEKINFEGLDIDQFKAFVGDVLMNYKFKDVRFGGTANNYFIIKVERKGCEEK